MEFLIALAVVMGVAWGTAYVLRGSLLDGCVMLLIVASCLGNDFMNFQLGPMPMTLDRVAFVAVIGAYVIQRRLGKTDPKAWSRLETWLVFLLGWMVISAVSGYLHEGDEMLRETKYRFISGYFMPAAIYWVARQSRLDETTVRRAHGLLAAFGAYLAFTGVCEVLRLWPLVFPRYISDPMLGLHFGRARGPFVHSVSLGLYLGVCLLATYVWRQERSRPAQLLAVLIVPLYLAAIFCTYTRSVWIGSTLGLTTVVGLTLKGAWRPIVVGGTLLVGLVVGVTQLERIMYMKREHKASEAAGSVNMRATFAYVSWHMFLDRPIAGVGFGQFPKAKLPYLDDRQTEMQLNVIRTYSHHNTFLSILTETGGLGFFVFCGLLAMWTREAWRLWRATTAPAWVRGHGLLLLGAMCVYVLQLVFHELTYSPVHNLLMFLLAGMAVGLKLRYVHERSVSSLHLAIQSVLMRVRRVSLQVTGAGAQA